MAILTFDEHTTDNVRLTYQGAVTDNNITLHFHTLTNNNPQSNGDLIAFYEADDMGVVKPDAQPLQITEVNKDTAETTIRLKNVPRAQRSYAFAYVQGNKRQELESTSFSKAKVSSLLSLPKNAVGGSAFNISLNIYSEGDTVTLAYTGIPNSEPQNVAWIGIWKQQNLNLSSPPDFFYRLEESGSTNDIEINNLLVNTDYYLGYFMDGYDSSKDKLKVEHQGAYIKFKTLF